MHINDVGWFSQFNRNKTEIMESYKENKHLTTSFKTRLLIDYILGILVAVILIKYKFVKIISE